MVARVAEVGAGAGALKYAASMRNPPARVGARKSKNDFGVEIEFPSGQDYGSFVW